MDDLKPAFVNYRNPQDDKIKMALQRPRGGSGR
jgi:hypothetical protein